MRTADQIIEENFTNQFTHSEKVIIKQLMQIVHRQACEEQRHICSNVNLELTGNDADRITGWRKAIIKNAPEPELK